MKNILYFLICLLLISSCELERDNPLDANNSNSNNNGTPLLAFSKFVVTSDDNNNGIINEGETIKLKIYIKNKGTSTAKSVNAKFSFDGYSYIYNYSVTTVNFGDIYPSTENVGILSTTENYTITFTLNSYVPNGTIKMIDIIMTDATGASWTDSFTFTVQ